MLVLVDHGVEATLLEDADRREVVESDPRVKGPGGLDHEKRREGPSGDAFAPVLATNPVADEPPGILFPTADVPNDHAADDDGAGEVLRAEDHCPPVGYESVALPRWKCGHAQRFWVALVLEEDRKVVICDVAEDHLKRVRPVRALKT